MRYQAIRMAFKNPYHWGEWVLWDAIQRRVVYYPLNRREVDGAVARANLTDNEIPVRDRDEQVRKLRR